MVYQIILEYEFYSTLDSLCLKSNCVLNVKEKISIKTSTYFVNVSFLNPQSFGLQIS